MTIYEKLMEYRDEKYSAFQSKLVPNISPDTIIGVRTPDMRAVAKEFFGTDEAKAFLTELPHKYYEENLVHFFLVANI
nr:DNA alkylation repair protein [Treponemataceae bacterium]